MANGWIKIKAAADYADVSKRTFEDWIKGGLRYIKIRGTRLTKPEWVDEFLTGFEVSGSQVDSMPIRLTQVDFLEYLPVHNRESQTRLKLQHFFYEEAHTLVIESLRII